MMWLRFSDGTGVPRAVGISTYLTDPIHPQRAAVDAFALNNPRKDEPLRSWWLGQLVRRLQTYSNMGSIGNSSVVESFAQVDAIQASSELDRIEQALPADKIVFATYDYLDQIGALETNIRRRWIRALL